MKKTTKSVNGTSFHCHTFKSTPNQLISLLGSPSYIENDGENKTNIEWHMELENGNVFTIYDWKNYFILDMDGSIEWHIGGHNSLTTGKALAELEIIMILHNENNWVEDDDDFKTWNEAPYGNK